MDILFTDIKIKHILYLDDELQDKSMNESNEILKKLCEKLKDDKIYDTLCVNYKIDKKIAKCLSESLNENKTIKNLILQCELSNESMKELSLSEGIKTNKSMSYLCLAGEINHVSAKYLSNALKENKSIQHLVLQYEIKSLAMKYTT